MGATRSHAHSRWINCTRAGVALALAALIAGVAGAADPVPSQPAQGATSAAVKAATAKPLLPASQFKEGTLVVFNRPILTFRANFIGNSPAQRAENSQERIKAILAHDGPG